jgi:hypothetical protein
MRGSIAPKMKINIETSANESSNFINGKTHILARDRETKVIVTLKLHIEIPLIAPNT